MTTSEIRDRFSTRLLSSCTPAEVRTYVEKLEELVRDSEYGVSPGPAWIGPRNDTLLVFLDGDLVGGICPKTLAFLDPLVFDETGIAFPALVLNELRLRAEGLLIGNGFKEYYFHVPEQAEAYIKGLLSMGGIEEIKGVRIFKRRL